MFCSPSPCQGYGSAGDESARTSKVDCTQGYKTFRVRQPIRPVRGRLLAAEAPGSLLQATHILNGLRTLRMGCAKTTRISFPRAIERRQILVGRRNTMNVRQSCLLFFAMCASHGAVPAQVTKLQPFSITISTPAEVVKPGSEVR